MLTGIRGAPILWPPGVMTLAGAISDLPDRLQSLLESDVNRGEMLHTLAYLAQDKGFGDLADVWAPALVDRDPRFFRTFLLRHLDGIRHAKLIRDLLPRVEQAGADELFTGLYRLVIVQAQWEEDLAALAGSSAPAEQVVAAVLRRDVSPMWYRLSEPTALALYERAPEAIGPYLQAHMHPGWGLRQERYVKLRKAAQARDDALYWYLFRQYATEGEWKTELQSLLSANVPAGTISAELEKRHPETLWQADTDVVVTALDKYGLDALPYIERHLGWISRRSAGRLLTALEKLGDEGLYWRIFFLAGRPDAWNSSLWKILRAGLSPSELHWAVQLRTPTGPHTRWRWQLQADVAMELYKRDRTLYRPLIDGYLSQPTMELVREAHRNSDDDFLDMLCFKYLGVLPNLHYRAFPQAGPWAPKPDPKAKEEFGQVVAWFTERFDAMHRDDPERYVLHAGSILRHYHAFAIWSVTELAEKNPVLHYLLSNHAEAWLAAPGAVRDLLESTCIHVQIAGLDFLGAGGKLAAQRVAESVPLLYALLLGRARRSTKRKALKCLQEAAQEGPQYAEVILPTLEEALHLEGRRAIDEEIIAAVVRTKKALREKAAG